MGLRNGTRLTKRIRETRPTRAYRIKGVLGRATDTFYKDGKTIEKTTYKHVQIYNIERLLAHLQASHQKKMFE